jgi:hypothetical protein
MSSNTTNPPTAPTPKYTGPETALAVFHYEFSVHPKREVTTPFSLGHHPVDWHNLTRSPDASTIASCISSIALEHNGAAKLLLILFWHQILKDQDGGRHRAFWTEVRKEAWMRLNESHGKPEQYLG